MRVWDGRAFQVHAHSLWYLKAYISRVVFANAMYTQGRIQKFLEEGVQKL